MVGLAVVVVVAMFTAGCSESTAIGGTARDVGVVERIVRDVADDVAVVDDALPIVFVTGIDGTIDIDVQAGVAAALVDEVDVRFADERLEAIDETTEELAVREGGVLVVIDEIPPAGRTFDLEVDRYTTVDDRDRLVVSFQWRAEQWTVTSTTVVPPVVTD